ncbi:fluoride efflux transporter CrcB [Streptomyces sp. NPDC059696]|uniref:fluoride efflux transporter CrcB n=1 Tax=Streptomyces sp. NPDC059696 TaxID=3346911 RepID=UPI0036A03723
MTSPESLHVRASAPRRPSWRAQAPVVTVVALGGGAGAAARYAASLWWPTPAGGFPWTTLVVNIAGCAVIGVFMVIITEVGTPHPLVRPFFGTGVLGGFTTFSAYAVDIRRLVDGGQAATALAYLAATPLAALTAVWLAAGTTRRVLKRRKR